MASTSTRKYKTICVFCGSNPGKDKAFTDMAIRLGEALAKEKISLIYGGGIMGLMGTVATSANNKGCFVLGVIPRAFKENGSCRTTIGKELTVWSIPDRIAFMFDMADAFIALPGGFGTLEEISCILSWLSLIKNKKPICLFNVNNYYNNLLLFLDNAVENGFVSTEARNVLISAETVEELLDKLQAFEYHPNLITQQIAESRKRKRDTDKREMDLTLSL